MTVLAAARIMGRRHVGSLIVTRQGKPVGILTERDLLTKAFSKGLAPGRTRVKRLMSSPLTVVHPDRELKEAARIMAQLHIRRLPVLQNGQLVGIVTAADIVAALARAPLAV
jgi:CBS domain-containing protein